MHWLRGLKPKNGYRKMIFGKAASGLGTINALLRPYCRRLGNRPTRQPGRPLDARVNPRNRFGNLAAGIFVIHQLAGNEILVRGEVEMAVAAEAEEDKFGGPCC